MHALDRPEPGRAEAACAAALAAGAAGLLLVATTAWGCGLDWDAVEYLSAAESLGRGDGWLQVDGKPLTQWAPLMSALLAALHFVGLDFAVATRALHAAALFALVWSVWRLARRSSGSAGVAAAAAGWLALLPALHENFTMGWSEPVFLALVALALDAGDRYLRAPRAAPLVLCAAWCALAALQRYLGVALIAAVAAALVCASPGAWTARVRRALLFAAAAAAPLALWCARNVALCGQPFGPRSADGAASAQECWARTTHTLGEWCATGFEGAQGVRFALLAAALLASTWLVLRRRPAAESCLLLGFLALYLAATLWASVSYAQDAIGERQLIPLAVGFAPLVAAGLGAARGRAPAVLATALLAAHFVWAAPELVRRLRRWRADGAGLYSTRAWREGEFSRWLAAARFEGAIASNDRHALFALSGARAAPTPRRAASFAERLARQSDAPLTVVWFEFGPRNRFPIDLLTPQFEVRTRVALDGGQVYELAPTAER
jgi:hypothetical protein